MMLEAGVSEERVPEEIYKGSAKRRVGLDGILANYLVQPPFIQAPQALLYNLVGVGPDAIGMGAIQPPQGVLFPNDLNHASDQVLVPEGSIALPMPELARFQVEAPGGELSFILYVHAMEHLRDPSGSALP